MSFLGPKLFIKIDNHLREAFPQRQQEPFGGISIILVGDLGQLPLVFDKPIYVSSSTAIMLWKKFNIVITLDIIFRQQGQSQSQNRFREILHNIRNVEALQDDWETLMNRTNNYLSAKKKEYFDIATHLFATNEFMKLHNKKMLKQLNLPIALCLAKVVGPRSNDHNEDDQLQQELLLCIGQQIMLTKNLWIQVGLANGALGQITAIVYNINSKPPELLKYVVVKFKIYIGPPWDTQNTMSVPISPITQMATIDIGTRERQGLTFTAISRVKSIDKLRIHPPFTYERYCKMENNYYTSTRKKEEACLQLLSTLQPATLPTP